MSYNSIPNKGNSQPNLIKELNDEIDHTKTQLLNTCDKLCDRDEHLENILTKAENLNADANIFRNESRKLKNKMWWKETHFYIIIFMLIVFITLIIIFSIKK